MPSYFISTTEKVNTTIETHTPQILGNHIAAYDYIIWGNQKCQEEYNFISHILPFI